VTLPALFVAIAQPLKLRVSAIREAIATTRSPIVARPCPSTCARAPRPPPTR
jgi:hypothetical protein